MKKLKSLALMALALLPTSKALAQTNAQVLYDFGTDRKYVTLTLEMFKQDKWGSTYFFVDHDFNYDKMDPNSDNVSLGGTYTEISRALNFWKDSSLKNWSLHAEYNGGITKNYPINNAWLFGVEYLIHDATYKNTLNLEVLYKTIRKKLHWYVLVGLADPRHTVFITEPQLWYNVGQHFGCENLSLGGEVEITNNFGSTDGAKVRPCLGVKWDF